MGVITEMSRTGAFERDFAPYLPVGVVSVI
jgi:hypothetical protein